MRKQAKACPLGKTLIEVCLISARGLSRPTLTLWKQHWYAVGWADPSHKYCTQIDASGKPNPVWKTKFSIAVDPELGERDLTLNVEVYSREVVLLREKLQGCATINMKEFLAKYHRNNNVEGCIKEGDVEEEDVGSFQLRKKRSNKPLGFIDVSFRISEDKNQGSTSCSFIGDEEGFNLQNSSGITIQANPGGVKAEPPFNPYAYPVPYPHRHNYGRPSVGMSNYLPNVPSYPFPGMGMQAPPLPSSSSTANNTQSTSYINMPSSSGAGRGVGLGFGVGLGAGALAAGAVMFGGDFMSAGFELPTVMPNPSLTMSIDPLF